MSDPKRILFTTIGDCKKSQTNPLSSASKTIRLDFNLFEPNADSFPEFNYSKLLHVEKVIFSFTFFFVFFVQRSGSC